MTLSRGITYTLHKLGFLMDKIGDTTLQKHFQMTFSQFKILIAINHKKDASQRDIADFWDMTEAAVSRQIEILMNKKLVARRENKENRREHLLNLTQSGLKSLDKATKLLDQEYGKIYSVIPLEEQKILVNNLDTLLQTICRGEPHSFCNDTP